MKMLPSECLERAAACERLAEAGSDECNRRQLLAAARCWRTLADHQAWPWPPVQRQPMPPEKTPCEQRGLIEAQLRNLGGRTPELDEPATE